MTTPLYNLILDCTKFGLIYFYITQTKNFATNIWIPILNAMRLKQAFEMARLIGRKRNRRFCFSRNTRLQGNRFTQNTRYFMCNFFSSNVC